MTKLWILMCLAPMTGLVWSEHHPLDALSNWCR